MLPDVIDLMGWVCTDCRTILNSHNGKLHAAIARLTEQLADVHVSLAFMKTEIDELKQKLCVTADNAVDTKTETDSTALMGRSASTNRNCNAAGDNTRRNLDISTVSSEVYRTLTDITRRKKNVVVRGLPESLCESNEQGFSDETAFLQLCEEHLSTKPSLSFKGCMRLGKLTGNNQRPRRLLVHLTSEENASNLLSDAKNLRRSDDSYIAQSVYINPDMSPAEAKLAFEKRAKKRAKQEAQAQTAKPRDGNRPANGAVLAAVSESSTTTSTEPNEQSAVDSCRSLVPTTSPSTSPSSPDYAQVGTTGDISDRCGGAVYHTTQNHTGGLTTTLSALSKQFVPSSATSKPTPVENK